MHGKMNEACHGHGKAQNKQLHFLIMTKITVALFGTITNAL